MRRVVALAMLLAAASEGKVTIGQIQDRLKALRNDSEQAVKQSQPMLLTVGGAVVVAVIAIAFLLGRRRGKKRATVLEIRRV